MTDRLVRTTSQQEFGHPSNRALSLLRSYVVTEAFIQSLESEESDDEGISKLIKETRDQHLAFFDKLTQAEKHFYNEIKILLDKNSGEDVDETELQDLLRNGFSPQQVQEFVQLINILHPKDTPNS
ncbi:hypothetical protein A3D07_00985 [Candidatus Curtissbacteria bacterium RIFCSPHIGHO2_02_FULL_42_15]|uniref:Uncharacterized protein n=1 Tax=Candidatus Curtissbacteria bacterium RIFCSPHIGHO2_02_FULL_42_15 TaxID=1797716 RepID=A0A1F5GCR2_9BACT|nr:MAG: hypothetical protein A3D07_00985 [Candidatus Curtissbacteria bacterium RIFCSPHIGHO2_02_FULL_42_15]